MVFLKRNCLVYVLCWCCRLCNSHRRCFCNGFREIDRFRIKIAQPFMEELDLLISIISQDYLLILYDSNGVALSFINKSSRPYSNGNQCPELYDSSYAVACAIRQGLVAEVSGYEQMDPCIPNCHSTSAAICNAYGSVSGVLTLAKKILIKILMITDC